MNCLEASRQFRNNDVAEENKPGELAFAELELDGSDRRANQTIRIAAQGTWHFDTSGHSVNRINCVCRLFTYRKRPFGPFRFCVEGFFYGYFCSVATWW